MYITSLSEDGYEYYLAISFSSTQTVLYILKLRNFTTQKGQNMACILYCMVIKQAFQYKTKGIFWCNRTINIP